MPDPSTHYRGRFAPSPTGPLHLGSLIAALASFLDARHHAGAWLVRMEDLDPPREEPGAADAILNSLRCHGLHWDGDVLYQSTRSTAYSAALARLDEEGLLFACDCSRAMLSTVGACAGDCRTRQDAISSSRAIRIAVPAECEIQFSDGLQQHQHTKLGRSVQDFIVKRKDRLHAYQLAVVVDDAEQGITHVVRGSDLLDSTARQIFLQQVLSQSTPLYFHLPVITTGQGQKFSKQNLAPALDNEKAMYNLRCALRFLQQHEPPSEIKSVDLLLAQAVEQWSPARVPVAMTIGAESIGLHV